MSAIVCVGEFRAPLKPHGTSQHSIVLRGLRGCPQLDPHYAESHQSPGQSIGFFPVWPADWENVHWPPERLASLGIMGGQLRTPPQTPQYDRVL